MNLNLTTAKFICVIHLDILCILIIENSEQRVWGQKLEHINLA